MQRYAAPGPSDNASRQRKAGRSCARLRPQSGMKTRSKQRTASPPINENGRTGHKTGFATCDERDELGEFVRRSDPPNRQSAGNLVFRVPLRQTLLALERLDARMHAPAVEIAGCHEVDADIVRCKRARERLGQARDSETHYGREQQMRRWLMRGCRSEEHDVATLVGAHRWHAKPRKPDRAHQQEVASLPPLVV